MFEIASEEAGRLSRLKTEFLDYASTRPPKLTDASIGDTIAYVADASRAHASTKGVHFELEVPAGLTVRADEGQLQQALMNLLLNAVDASPAGRAIVVRVHNGNHDLSIEIENTGAPIGEPALSRIFEPFFTTKPHGTGLGLAIARNIARAQGGDLILAANESDRVCFSLILPASGETEKD
jgi:two-component system sensor histidine kinase AtoS